MEYRDWLDQEDLLAFIENGADAEECLVYESVPKFIICGVLVPQSRLRTLDIEDVLQWNYIPPSSWGISYSSRGRVSVSPPMDHTGSKTLDRGEPIFHLREFKGREDKESYFELSQRFAHLFDLHYVPERDAYCRFDDLGDIEEIATIRSTQENDPFRGERCITILRCVLDEYMALTGQVMIRLFDSMRLDAEHFNDWRNHHVETRNRDNDIHYRFGVLPGTASYMRGFQIIRPRISKGEVSKGF